MIMIQSKFRLEKIKHWIGKGKVNNNTLTVSLWESGMGKPSLRLTTEYLPTVMALVLMSSEMHLVAPDWRSNRIESATVNMRPKRMEIKKLHFSILIDLRQIRLNATLKRASNSKPLRNGDSAMPKAKLRSDFSFLPNNSTDTASQSRP